MLLPQTTCIGIDPDAGRKSFAIAALDSECNLLALSDGDLDDALTFISNFPSVIVAVNSPSRLSRARTKRTTAFGVDMRAAERELRRRGILVPKTPARLDQCAPRMQLGFKLYRQLGKAGFRVYPDDDASHLWLETNSHACFCALVGLVPLHRRALEGRLQRQLALYDLGLGIKDPMDFFEEITRHRLLMGQLPTEPLYTSPQLDALAAAYTAWMVAHRPAETTRVGEQAEGFIVLPVGELKEEY